ncbi:MAG: DUF2309 domain-containing protein [Gammaproteobacteria bacterium]
MSLSLGQKLRIRAMIYVAGEPIAFFWPMRSFIHHNPLHGLEHMPFPVAVEKGTRLFHGRGYLPRSIYQCYLARGQVDHKVLGSGVECFASSHDVGGEIDLARWLMTLLTDLKHPVSRSGILADVSDMQAALTGRPLQVPDEMPTDSLADWLREQLLGDRPVYEAVDALQGTAIAEELDDLVIKSCLDFFDEGQSVWGMPERERGFFAAWREVARCNVRLFLRGLHINRILAVDESPEGVIAHVMESLQIPEERWVDYFTREIARLHGWAGFIRWRSSAKHYYWAQRYPGDLVDFVAVRLTLALALLSERSRRGSACTGGAIEEAIETCTAETYLRHELYSGKVLPAMAHAVEDALSRGREAVVARVFFEYTRRKRSHEAALQAGCLRELAARVRGGIDALENLSLESLGRLLKALGEFEKEEGMLWLRAMEAHAMERLATGVSLTPPAPRAKRPFVQALFCIDTRAERIRRHLEAVGDYQTFGIAGFFGVPVSFMELGKGSETHLCPVLLTPKNLVLEMTTVGPQDEAALTTLEKAMHELKESVLTPFVTVEAIGLLFGFDMVGKTVAPRSYNRWRKRLHAAKPPTRLLLDKLSREQADSIVRAVQRALIVKAVEQEFGLAPERINDDMVRALRESALGHPVGPVGLADPLGLGEARQRAFVERLRDAYRINHSFAQLQMERLGRIGFTLDEQVQFVGQALRAIGLTAGFSRFILLVGHGSTSQNNPYESALDCGACGGNHGLVSARVLAQMANKPEVRRRLREQSVDIADDAWFVPTLHNTTTDTVELFDLDLMPPSHLVYLDRLHKGLVAASRLCARERLPSLEARSDTRDAAVAYRGVQRNAMDWSQVRPEWGLSRNAYFIIGRRALTQRFFLAGRAFLHSYDYRLDAKLRLLENILTGPLVVAQWINMEHYFSTVDNECFGSGSKVYHNVAGRFGVMTGNLSDLRTGLPSQTVLKDGLPYHEPLRLITLIEAPFDHARRAIEAVATVKRLIDNGWIRLMVIDPETAVVSVYEDGEWQRRPHLPVSEHAILEEASAS